MCSGILLILQGNTLVLEWEVEHHELTDDNTEDWNVHMNWVSAQGLDREMGFSPRQ